MSKPLNEVPVMSHQPTECMDLGESLQHWELFYHMHVFFTGMDPLMGNVMCQVYNLGLEKQKLGGFQLQVELMEAFKYDA